MGTKCFFCNKIYVEGSGCHITELDQGKIIWFDLCHKCGQEYLTVLDTKKLAMKANKKKELIVRPKDRLCITCGMTLSQFQRVGRVGCKDCYKCFEKEISAVLAICQHDDLHVGKRPKDKSFDGFVQDLKVKRARAIELEQYEEAARITQQLKELGLDE